MACGCTTYECVEILVNPCNTGTDTGITASVTGDYIVAVEFNGVTKRSTVTVAANESINLPTEMLNENYTHEIRVTDPLGETVCYQGKTSISMDVPNAPYVPASTEWRLPYTVTETGSSITIAGLKPVEAILLPNGTLTKQQFTQVGDTITYTYGDFYENDEIVLIF